MPFPRLMSLLRGKPNPAAPKWSIHQVPDRLSAITHRLLLTSR